jgi:hypothetical protein
MKKLRSLLELYGSLDKVVLQSDDPQMAAAVDQLLPGATANKGWYREIEHFCFGHHPQGVKDEADPIQALNNIADRGGKLTDFEKLRLLHGVAAIARIQSVPAIGPLPHLKENDAMKDAVVGALAYLRPGKAAYDKRKAETRQSYDEFIGHLEKTTGRRAWPKITKESVDNNWIAQNIADVPLCKTSVVTVDGYQCVCIDTEFTSNDVSLNQVKAVADPRNWDQSYHDFFCAIDQLPERSDGWGRFLETVGFCGEDEEQDVLKLVTQLKYFKSTPSSTEANLDYDLDDPTPGDGDGQVKVDRGYINMRAPQGKPDKPPVHVRTRKVVHIDGVSPGAQARLVCITGYGTASRELLVGPAKNPPSNAVGWDVPVGGKDTTEEGDTGPQPISNVAGAAVKVWSDCAEDVMTRSFDLSEKWMAGRLNFNDLAQYSKDVSGLLLTAPWEFLQAMNQPRFPSGRSDQKPQGGRT